MPFLPPNQQRQSTERPPSGSAHGSGSRRDVRNDRMPAVKWSGWRCNELVVASPGRRRQHVHVTAARSPGSHDTGRHTHTHTRTHPSRNITARALCTPTVISSSMLIAQLHQTRPDPTRQSADSVWSGPSRLVDLAITLQGGPKVLCKLRPEYECNRSMQNETDFAKRS